MAQTDVQTFLLSMLTSIITGGFILVFVEIGNRKNRVNDKYDLVMVPFMHKLSSYFRFLNWCRSRIRYPRQLNENEREFKKLVTEIGDYGGRAITSGGDYGVDYFSADELNGICLKINNIWYYHDKMSSFRLKWDDYEMSENFITKELKEFLPNYLSHTTDVNLVSNVSGDFYTDIYQPIENETYMYEAYVRLFKWQNTIVICAVGFVLLCLNTMLFVQLPIWTMQMIGVLTLIFLIVCLMLLGVEMKVQIRIYNRIRKKIKGIRKHHNCMLIKKNKFRIILRKIRDFLFSNMIPMGLLLAAWSVLSIEIGIIPRFSVLWDESVVQGINRLFLNLSYSYIAGVIIYWFTVKFPNVKKKLNI